MAETPWLICASADLAEGGKGVRFEIKTETGLQSAVSVRHGGQVFAFLNRRAHIGIEPDWQSGKFFDESGLYLICATHGAAWCNLPAR